MMKSERNSFIIAQTTTAEMLYLVTPRYVMECLACHVAEMYCVCIHPNVSEHMLDAADAGLGCPHMPKMSYTC